MVPWGISYIHTEEKKEILKLEGKRFLILINMMSLCRKALRLPPIMDLQSEWVEGKKLIEGHKIFLITDEAQWIPNQELKQKSNNK